MPLPHLAFKSTLLKPFREFSVLGGSPCMALQCTSPSSQLWCFGLFGLTVLQAHKLVFGNKWRHKRRWKQPSLVWILRFGESQPLCLSHVCRLTPISSKMIEQDRGNRGWVGREVSADEGPAANSKSRWEKLENVSSNLMKNWPTLVRCPGSKHPESLPSKVLSKSSAWPQDPRQGQPGSVSAELATFWEWGWMHRADTRPWRLPPCRGGCLHAEGPGSELREETAPSCATRPPAGTSKQAACHFRLWHLRPPCGDVLLSLRLCYWYGLPLNSFCHVPSPPKCRPRASGQKSGYNMTPPGIEDLKLLCLFQSWNRLPVVCSVRISQLLLPLSNFHHRVVTVGGRHCRQVRLMLGLKPCLWTDLQSWEPVSSSMEWRTIVPAPQNCCEDYVGWLVCLARVGQREVSSKCLLGRGNGKHGARLQDAEPVGLIGWKPDPKPWMGQNSLSLQSLDMCLLGEHSKGWKLANKARVKLLRVFLGLGGVLVLSDKSSMRGKVIDKKWLTRIRCLWGLQMGRQVGTTPWELSGLQFYNQRKSGEGGKTTFFLIFE